MKLRNWSIIITLIFGVMGYYAIDRFCPVSLLERLIQKVDLLSTIIATFSFTMAGFLATILALLFGVQDKPFFKQYKHYGHLKTFLFIYFVSLISLFVTYLVSLFAFYHCAVLKLMLALSFVNILQLTVMSTIVYQIMQKSLDQKKDVSIYDEFSE